MPGNIPRCTQSQNIGENGTELEYPITSELIPGGNSQRKRTVLLEELLGLKCLLILRCINSKTSHYLRSYIFFPQYPKEYHKSSHCRTFEAEQPNKPLFKPLKGTQSPPPPPFLHCISEISPPPSWSLS